MPSSRLFFTASAAAASGVKVRAWPGFAVAAVVVPVTPGVAASGVGAAVPAGRITDWPDSAGAGAGVVVAGAVTAVTPVVAAAGAGSGCFGAAGVASAGAWARVRGTAEITLTGRTPIWSLAGTLAGAGVILAVGVSLVTVVGARVRPGATTTGGSAPDNTTTPGSPAAGPEAVELKGRIVTAGISGPVAVAETALDPDVTTPGRAS